MINQLFNNSHSPLVLCCSEVKAMDLFRKLRERPRGKRQISDLVSWDVCDVCCEGVWCLFSEQRCVGDCQEVIKLVVQAIQFYEKKLRDFYTHLRFISVLYLSLWSSPVMLSRFNAFVCLCVYSKTMACRQRVLELLPRVEGMVSAMAQSEEQLLHLQEKRQKELWNLLKVACVRHTHTEHKILYPTMLCAQWWTLISIWSTFTMTLFDSLIEIKYLQFKIQTVWHYLVYTDQCTVRYAMCCDVCCIE